MSSTSKKRTHSAAFKPSISKPSKDLAVPIGKGQELAAQTHNKFKRRKLATPPTHKQIQSDAQRFGASMGKRFVGLSTTKRAKSIVKMESLAAELEKQNKSLLPSSHAKRVEGLLTGKNVTGKAFRAIEPGLDEATQSQTTASFHSGFSSAISKDKSGDALKFQKAFLRVQSAMRMKTEHVVAPVSEGGSTFGQQHPTRKGIPKVQQGGSAHSHADRERAANWVKEGVSYSSRKKSTGVFTPLVRTVVAAGSSTLDRMSFPLSATNVSGGMFGSKPSKEQTTARETFKGMVNTAAERVKIQTDKSTQKVTASKVYTERPGSPIRK